MDLFQRQCVTCSSDVPACTCSADQSCVQIARTCSACPTFVCQVASSSSSSGSSGGSISSGVLAGAIVAVLLVLVGALLVFFLYRRRLLARQSRDVVVEPKLDVPAPAEAVLNRPDPTEKPQPSPTTPSTPTNTVRVYPSTGNSVIDLDPRSQSSLHPSSRHASGGPSVGNPFDDRQSIQTTSTTTNGTNVIPIALVSPGSVQASSPRSESGTFPPSSPARPARPTDLVLDGPQLPFDPLTEPSSHYAHSHRSTASRNSCVSNASYSSDFLNEAPMIVTHSQGAVRQVVGKARAEVIQTSGNVSPTSVSDDTLKPPSVASRPPVRSPLASSSFGPADIASETEDDHDVSARSDPFGDHHAASEQGSAGPDPSKPVLLVQPEIVINDGITRDVKHGSSNARFDPKSSYGTSMAKLLPLSPIPSSTLQEQQQRALAHAQAQARAQGLDKSKRMSGTSVVSTTSTRADSILESFPFVPPSPISSRPVRSPPRSPLRQQFATVAQSQTPLAAAASAVSHIGAIEAETSLPPLDPPSRRILGMSTGSQLSTASSGLGNFPFQIDHGGAEGAQIPSGVQGRQRASLDTLALMTDLSSYPLGYDRDDHDSLPPLPKS